MYPVSGTYYVYVSLFLEKLKYIIIIVFCHFYLFQNGLIDLQTPKGWHFIKKINTILHKMLKIV